MHAFWLIELSNKLTLIKNKNSNLCAYMGYENFNRWSFSKLINWHIKEGASYSSTIELIEVDLKNYLLVIT